MNTVEDKPTLVRLRAELVEKLATPLAAVHRIRLQGDLSVINAKIKALNTTTAARLKAAADQRKAAGLAESQANAARARAHAGLATASSAGKNETGDVGTWLDDHDLDPGQTADGWIDAVLLRHDITFSRTRAGGLAIHENEDDTRVSAIKLLVDGVYAAARGQELPELGEAPPKAAKSPKVKSKKR